MKVAEIYIMRRVVAIFLMTLLWVLTIVWTTQVLVRINLVTSDGQSAATFFEIAGLVLPSVIPIVVPFAIGIAVAQTLATMNTDSELIVLTAAGSPRSVVVRPIMIAAVVAAVAAFGVENFVEPHARERLRNLIADARAELVTTIIQEGTFQQIDDGLVIQIAERLPDGRFGGIFVSDTREKGIELIYYAREGAAVEVEDRHLILMEDGTIQRRNQAGEVSWIRYHTYALDLSEFQPPRGDPTMFPKDRTIAYLMNPDPADSIFQRRPQMFRGELHRRFTDWLYSIVFAMVGLAVAADARSFREARIHPLLTTMGAALVVRWAGFIAANGAAQSALYVPLMYAVPVSAIAAAAFMIATNRRLEFPTAWAERIQTLMGRLHDRIAAFRFGRRAEESRA